MNRRLFVGLMSGTSMDGIDGVLVELSGASGCDVLGHVHRPFDAALRNSLFDLNRSGPDELHLAALAGNAIAQAYADVVHALLSGQGCTARQITAIGAHGQTVRHRPGEFDRWGYTCQLLNGALLAELSGVDVVCDFRSRDVAAGGQGAPLVPAFHRAVFGAAGVDTAVLNIGGIANLSLLHADGRTTGHDCGPGNVLLDLWCQRHTGQAYDAGGAWSTQGHACAPLLQHLLLEPFLTRRPPKSTGRDLFHADWLDSRLNGFPGGTNSLRPEDIQATLVQFTAQAIVNDLRREMPAISELLVCGGGACNTALMNALELAMVQVTVHPIQQKCRMEPFHVEAAAFAWLASQFVGRQPGNCTDVTGANGPKVLGALYPA